MAYSVTPSRKRPLDEDFDYQDESAPFKKPRIEERRVSHFAQIVITNSYQDMSRNVVWLNDDDFFGMFSVLPIKSSDPVQPRYVQIATRVYQVAVGQGVSRGLIGLSRDQYGEINETGAIFTYQGTDAVQLSSFSPLPSTINNLQSIVFEIEANDDFGPITGIKTFDLQELRTACLQSLNGKYAVPGQIFYIDHKVGRFNLTVKDMDSTAEAIAKANTESRALSPFGRITKFTTMDFEIINNKKISIVNRKNVDQNTIFTFVVTLLSDIDSTKNEDIPLPLKVDLDKFAIEIRSKLAGENLVLGDKRIIYHDGWKMQIRCEKVSDDEIADTEHLEIDQELNDIISIFIESIDERARTRRENPSAQRKFYDQSYAFQQESKLYFKGSRDIIFTHKEIYKAKQMDFEVVSITERDTLSGSRNSKWVDVANFIKQLQTLPYRPVKGQKFHLKLPNAKVVVRMKKAKSIEQLPKKTSKGWKRQWSLDENTEINLNIPQYISWKLVDSPAQIGLDKVIVKVIPKESRVITLSEKELIEAARKAMSEGIVLNQTITAEVNNNKIDFQITDFDYPNKSDKKFKYGVLGKLSPTTVFQFENDGQYLAITEKKITKDPVALLEEMGFGGLTPEGKDAIRMLVGERISPMKEAIQGFGLIPTKGFLLYGPPGNGKTLFARCLGSILGCDKDHIKLLSCTEVLNKWVGESERIIRELFNPAREAAETHKKDSEVFVLVLDELDAVLGKRHSDSKSWEIAMVNEFLTQMDGLKVFNNIIVVGLTNRFEALDPATLRPGRFELKLELAAPDENGRKEILMIHSKELRARNKIDKDVDFNVLAKKTAGFSGAELRFLIAMTAKKALKNINQRIFEGKETIDVSKIVLSMKDFENTIPEIAKADKKELSDSIRHIYT